MIFRVESPASGHREAAIVATLMQAIVGPISIQLFHDSHFLAKLLKRMCTHSPMFSYEPFETSSPMAARSHGRDKVRPCPCKAKVPSLHFLVSRMSFEPAPPRWFVELFATFQDSCSLVVWGISLGQRLIFKAWRGLVLVSQRSQPGSTFCSVGWAFFAQASCRSCPAKRKSSRLQHYFVILHEQHKPVLSSTSRRGAGSVL